ncbi:MAG: transporter [candidate division NC10 bacterium]|nr:transporter [candidate division NC10 bacterium]
MSGPDPSFADPIVGVGPTTLFSLGTAVRGLGVYTRLSDGGNRLTIWEAPVLALYSPRRDLNVALSLPYVSKNLTLEDGRQRGAEGVGDLRLFGLYRFFRQDRPHGTIEATLLGGLKLPTGDSGRRDAQGRLPPALQPGSGSVDGLVGLNLGSISRRWGLYLGALGKVNSAARGFKAGDMVSYDLTVQYQLFPDWPIPDLSQFNVGLELVGTTATEDRVGGTSVSESGGTEFFLAPGFQYFLGPQWLIEAAVELPISRGLERPLGLKPDVIVIWGFRGVF